MFSLLFNNVRTTQPRSESKSWLLAEMQTIGALFYVLNALYYALVQLLKPPLRKKMERNEEKLIVVEHLEVGDHDHEEEDVDDVREGAIRRRF